MLQHEITQGIPFLNLTGRFGNIYVNIIIESVIVIDEQSVVFGSAYIAQNIHISLSSIKKIFDAHKDSKNPHNFDPSFIFGIGSKESQSDNYQQWLLTFNPAYSYLRPWWIGKISFTLLSTSTYPLELQLSPGFCPYIPTGDIKNLQKTGQPINGYFLKLNILQTLIRYKMAQKCRQNLIFLLKDLNNRQQIEVWMVLGGIVNPSAFLPYASMLKNYQTINFLIYKQSMTQRRKQIKVLTIRLQDMLTDASAEIGLVDQETGNKSKKVNTNGNKKKLKLSQEDPEDFLNQAKIEAQNAITKQISKQISICDDNISKLIDARLNLKFIINHLL